MQHCDSTCFHCAQTFFLWLKNRMDQFEKPRGKRAQRSGPGNYNAAAASSVGARWHGKVEYFDPEIRAREKQASRDDDVRQLAAGEVTVDELRRRNGAFAFPRDRVRLVFPKRER